jgi:hypothetical protein
MSGNAASRGFCLVAISSFFRFRSSLAFYNLSFKLSCSFCADFKSIASSAVEPVYAEGVGV